MSPGRRSFIKTSGLAGAALSASPVIDLFAGTPGAVEVLNPYNRAPVSLIIDDSTCLVNLAYYGIPQFAEVFPEQYKQDWRRLPHEIPDSFVREFGEWCHENGIKGKYSIVPYPACTGWVSRFIPGWTRKELEDSLKLIREVILPDWDIHPEMVSHTRVINIKTGIPYPQATPEYMENWEWSQAKSTDELAAYQAYALGILKEAGLPCDGITTPGGYGQRNQENLAISVFEAVREVYGAEIPHFFRDLYTEKGESVSPRVLQASGLTGPDPKCVVSILGCTGDWFGDWDGLNPGGPDNFISEDLQKGRMVDVIDSGEPAVMVCHWPGIYFNGDRIGFSILKQVVDRLNRKYDHLVWMKLSEIARYWAAKQLTAFRPGRNSVAIQAPFSAKGFTLKLNARMKEPKLKSKGEELKPLERISSTQKMRADTWIADKSDSILCFDLEKGSSEILW